MSVGPQIEGQNGGAVAVRYVPSPLSTCLLQEGPLFSLLHGPSNLSLWSPHLETPSHGVSSERLQAPASQLPPKASLPTQPLLPSPPLSTTWGWAGPTVTASSKLPGVFHVALSLHFNLLLSTATLPCFLLWGCSPPTPLPPSLGTGLLS